MPDRLFLFTKPAVPGRVKTRLIGPLQARDTARLHRAFVGDLATRLQRSDRFQVEVSWALDDGEQPPEWPELATLPWHRQRGKTLGDRLYASLASGAGRNERVAAVGSDHPELSPDTVESAFRALREGADMAIGPALDGGYYLIALQPQAVHQQLFEGIAWSTETVWEQTLERARKLGMSVARLPAGHDVDHPSDLEELARRLTERGSEHDCPQTWEVLASLGWLGKESAACES